MKNHFKKLSSITAVAVFAIVFSGCGAKYVKENIDDIVYAEPTEEAKNFDIEGYVESLPSVEYEKINYPVKETYTYNFNGYSMTVDIPEGFEAYEISPLQKLRVVDSASLEDSCQKTSADGVTVCADEVAGLKSIGGQSDKSLCIEDQSVTRTRDRICRGIKIYPTKSSFKGVSLRDKYVKIYATREDSKKHFVGGRNFLVQGFYSDHHLLISNDQSIGISPYGYFNGSPDEDPRAGYFKASQEVINLYFNIVSSIKIKKL